MIAAHDEQTIELAVIMNRSPSEIDQMPYLDSLSFMARHFKARRASHEFEAALHGRELR